MRVIGGHTVDAAYTGAEGLRMAAATKPNVILLDMILPDIDGIQVIDRLLSTSVTREIPVIFLTGADLTQTERQHLSLMPNFYRLEEKPCDFNVLLGHINRIAGSATARDN